MTSSIKKNTNSNANQPKLRRPIYQMDGKDMKVTYYDGEGHWKNTVFKEKDRSGGAINHLGQLAQYLTKFINQNAFSTAHGNINAYDMRSAWDRAQSLFASLDNTDRTGIEISIRLNRMDKIMDHICEDGIVTQQEQFTIMNCLANWLGKPLPEWF